VARALTAETVGSCAAGSSIVAFGMSRWASSVTMALIAAP